GTPEPAPVAAARSRSAAWPPDGAGSFRRSRRVSPAGRWSPAHNRTGWAHARSPVGGRRPDGWATAGRTAGRVAGSDLRLFRTATASGRCPVRNSTANPGGAVAVSAAVAVAPGVDSPAEPISRPV